MMRALGIAATGMQAMQTNVEVISNNIANVSTTGFKRSLASFQDLLYQSKRRPEPHHRKAARSFPPARRSDWACALPA